MTVIVTAVFHPRVGHKEELRDALAQTIPAVHREAGCELYAIHDAEDGTITMIEKWDDAESLRAHAAGPAVALLGAAVADFVSAPTTVTKMTPIPVGASGQGTL